MAWEHKKNINLIEGERYSVLDNQKFVHKVEYIEGKFINFILKIEIKNINWIWR